MWYVYFLELSNRDVYVGSTNDLKRRFSSHQAGEVVSTKRNLPVKLKSYVAVETEVLARELERYFKSGSGKAFASKRFWKTCEDGKHELTALANLPQTQPPS
jgi:predicted GIY-YIG superfamily endonuclease